MSCRGHLTRSLSLAVVLLGALALAGCGGNGEAVEDDNPLAQAAAATIEQGTASVLYEASFDGPEGSYAFDAEGAVDYEAFQARLAYDLSDVPDGGDNAEVRIDAGTVFVRFPEGSEDIELPEGVEWIRLPPPAAPPDGETAEGEVPEQPIEIGGIQQDPTQFLRYLRTGATDIHEEGTEQIRGAPTTIYTALIDLERVLEQDTDVLGRDEEHRAIAIRAAESLRAQLGDVPIPVTVNVDEEGRVRRLLLSLDILGAAGARVSALTTTDFFDFGTDVDVAPPPDEQVIDVADVE